MKKNIRSELESIPGPLASQATGQIQNIDLNLESKYFYKKTLLWDLQNVADDADGPHVGGETDGLEGDHLRCHKLRGAEQDLESN